MTRRRVLAVVALAAALGGGLVWRRGCAEPGQGGSAKGGGPDGGERNGPDGPDRIQRDPSVPAWFAQAGAPRRRIAGVVLFNGAPVAGAQVTLASDLTEAGFAQPGRATTDAAGRFDLGEHAAAIYAVTAEAPARTADVEIVDLRDPMARPAPDALELRLGACDVAVHGVVRDASGGVVAGARVRRRAWRGGGATTLTDNDGKYELCLPPGGDRLLVAADGYGTRVVTVAAYARVEKNIELIPEAVVVGRAVRADDGSPVAGAMVTLESAGMGELDAAGGVAITDAEGRFRIDGLLAGRYLAWAIADGLATARSPEVVALAGQTSAEIVCRLEGTSRLIGVVVAGDQPVAGVQVSALPRRATGNVASAVTQPDGTFVLTEVPRDELSFDVQDHELVSPQSFRVTDATHADLRLQVAALGTVRGRVVRDGRPIAGAEVYARPPPEALGGRAFTRSLGDGSFELRGIEGTDVLIGAQSETEGAFAREQRMTIARGEVKEGVVLELALSGAVSGVVVDQHGAPVAGVFVWLSLVGGEDYGHATTAPDGTFTARSLSGGGSYSIQVSRSPGSDVPIPPAKGKAHPTILVRDGTSQVIGVRVEIRLDRLVISGRVVDSRGAGLADVRVKAVYNESDEGPAWQFAEGADATTDGDGAFALEDLLAGSYTVFANAGSGSRAQLDAVPAGKHNLIITLEDVSGVDGTLAGFTGEVEVVAVGRSDRTAGRFQAHVEASKFQIRGLTPGPYVVIAEGAGGQTATALVDVPAGTIPTVALTALGTATIRGHVTEWRDGTPLAGADCHVDLLAGTSEGDPIWVPADADAISDARGRFELRVAAGDMTIRCIVDDGTHFGTGQLRRVLGANAELEAEIPIARRIADSDLGSIGAEIGADGDPDGAERIVIGGLTPGGPAERAGLQTGDVVIAIEGRSVAGLGAYGVVIVLLDRPVGSTVSVTVDRGGRQSTVSVTIGP